jgi:hypothetical protein
MPSLAGEPAWRALALVGWPSRDCAREHAGSAPGMCAGLAGPAPCRAARLIRRLATGTHLSPQQPQLDNRSGGGLPGREVGGQVPPGAPGAVQVQDRLADPPPGPDPGPSPPPGYLGRQVRCDHLPLGIAQVTGIAPRPPAPAPILGTRGPACFSDRHTSGSWGPAPGISAERHTSPPAQPRPSTNYQTLT